MTPTQRAAALRLAATLDSRMSADPEGDEEAAALLRELAAEPVQEATPADKAVYSAIAENYAAPQQRKPLTDEEIWRSDAIMECNANIGAHMNELMRLIRAVEQAHGIKETK